MCSSRATSIINKAKVSRSTMAGEATVKVTVIYIVDNMDHWPLIFWMKNRAAVLGRGEITIMCFLSRGGRKILFLIHCATT